MSLTLTGSINRIANDFTEEIWDKGNFKIADEILSINFIDHDPVRGQLPGLIGYKQMVKDFRNAFPDLRVKNEDVIVEGNKVVVRWTANGKHSGQLMNIPPTNKQVILKGIDILLVENNKITERWGEYDALGMLSQLGVLPQ
jgi:predicted ester cyclase